MSYYIIFIIDLNMETNEIKFPATQNQDVTVKPSFPSIKDSYECFSSWLSQQAHEEPVDFH